MSRIRLAATAATIACGLMLRRRDRHRQRTDRPGALTQVVPITGAAKGGKQFKGTYTIERFISKGGKLYSVGTLTGKLGSKKVTKENVRMPATVANAQRPGEGQPGPAAPAAAAAGR